MIQWRKEWTAPAVGVVGFAAGAAAGWFACQRKMSFDVDETVTATLEKFDEVHINVENPFQELDISIKEVNERLNEFTEAFRRNLQSSKERVNEEVEMVEDNIITPADLDPDHKNVFVQNPDWNYEEEQEGRSPDTPYVIHRDEFFNQETGYAQTQLTWYTIDQILADENDVPIYGPEKIVGRLEFGRGSGDPEVVYIRNEKLVAEYEISRHPGSFQVEILGIEAEQEAEANDLKHSNAIPKFRMD